MKDYKRKLLKTLRAQMMEAQTMEELNALLFGAIGRVKQKEFDHKLVVHHGEAIPLVKARVDQKKAELAAYYAWLNAQRAAEEAAKNHVHKGDPYNLHHEPIHHPVRQPSNTLESFYMEPWKWNATSGHPHSHHGGGS